MTKTSWKYAGQWVQNLHGWGRYLLLLTALIFVSSTAFAQLTTADILGTVADSTGAIIPGANVTVLNVDTHDKRTAQSNASGDYSFNLLQPGHYSVTVQATGFKATTQTLAVEAGDRAPRRRSPRDRLRVRDGYSRSAYSVAAGGQCHGKLNSPQKQQCRICP